MIWRGLEGILYCMTGLLSSSTGMHPILVVKSIGFDKLQVLRYGPHFVDVLV